MAIGFVMFYYLDKMEASLLYKVFIFLAIVIPVTMIRIFVGEKLFEDKQTLTEKIMSCNLRKKHGYSYCVECPDGYKCAANDMEKK